MTGDGSLTHACVCQGTVPCHPKNQDGIRFEIFEEVLFGYSNDSCKIYKFVETLKSDDYNIRHSNLEDLFLKVTGRNLNELQ